MFTETFAFTRPTDFAILNEGNQDFVAEYEEMIPKNYSRFVFELLKFHNVKPPYILIGNSHGCVDATAFSFYYKNSIHSLFLLDNTNFNYERKFDKVASIIYGEILDKNNWRYSIPSKPNNKKELEQYNIDIKSKAFFDNFPLWKLDKPIFLIWSDSINREDEKYFQEIVSIKNNFSKELEIYNNMVIIKWVDAPHQSYHTISSEIAIYIINSIILIDKELF